MLGKLEFRITCGRAVFSLYDDDFVGVHVGIIEE